MNKLPLRRHFPHASSIALGTMGLGGPWSDAPLAEADYPLAEKAILTAVEHGITVIDTADIYTMGKSEQVIGQVLARNPGLREKIVLETKGGIRLGPWTGGDGRYDLSKKQIIACVEASLERLAVETIDLWLMHRPDPLMEPSEIAEAMAQLHRAGKVRSFGVSNMHRHQIEFITAFSDIPLVVNQLEMSLHRHHWLEEGILVGMNQGSQVNFGPGTLEYCAINGIQVQAWSPLAQGRLTGKPGLELTQVEAQTSAQVAEYARELSMSPEAILLAWLQTHPVAIQPVIGTTNPQRIAAAAQALDATLTREQWYRLYISARGQALP